MSALATASPVETGLPWRDRAFLPLETAAEILGVSRSALYTMESRGDLAFRRIAGRTLVVVPSLIRLIERPETWAASDRGAAARAARPAREA